MWTVQPKLHYCDCQKLLFCKLFIQYPVSLLWAFARLVRVCVCVFTHHPPPLLAVWKRSLSTLLALRPELQGSPWSSALYKKSAQSYSFTLCAAQNAFDYHGTGTPFYQTFLQGVKDCSETHFGYLILSLLLLFFCPSQSLTQDQLVDRSAAEDRSVFKVSWIGSCFSVILGLNPVFLVFTKVCLFQRVSAPCAGGRGGERTWQGSRCSDNIRQRGRWEDSGEPFEPFRRAVCSCLLASVTLSSHKFIFSCRDWAA